MNLPMPILKAMDSQTVSRSAGLVLCLMILVGWPMLAYAVELPAAQPTYHPTLKAAVMSRGASALDTQTPPPMALPP